MIEDLALKLSNENGQGNTNRRQILYKRRWFILFVVSLVNFTGNMTWLTYAPISSFAITYFENSYAPALLNSVYMICSPIGFLAMYLLAKRNGLRIGCLVGAWLNFSGNLVRLSATCDGVSGFNMHSETRFTITLIGQFLAACGQPFSMYLPTKVAASWFPDSQRVIANSIGALACPLGTSSNHKIFSNQNLGSAAAYFLAPRIVADATPSSFIILSTIITSFAFIGALCSLGTSSNPPKPPSASAEFVENLLATSSKREKDNNNIYGKKFLPSLCRSFKHIPFVILTLCLGSIFGAYTGLYNILQLAMCSKGYDNEFSGLIGMAMILSGIVFSSLVGCFVDRTKLFEETMKVLMAFSAFFSSVLVIVLKYEPLKPAILVAIMCFGSTSIALYPVGMELGVETTYPIQESISTGLLLFAGQIFGFFYTMLTTVLRKPPTFNELSKQTCTIGGDTFGVYDLTYSLMFWNALLCFTSVLFTVTFWPKYRRIEYEQKRNSSKGIPS